MYFSKLLIVDIIKYADTCGADALKLFKQFNIRPELINPQEKVSYDEMIKVLNVVGETINDQFLGLHVAQHLMLKGTQQVNEIMQFSPTIEEAFSNAVNYSRLISDALDCKLKKCERQTVISFELNPNWAVKESHAVQQVVDLTLVSTMKSIFWLTGKKYTPTEVHLNNPRIIKRNEYFKIFDCSVKFNKPVAGIVFENPVLSQKLSSADLGLLGNLKNIANKALASIEQESTIVLNVKKIILEKLPQRVTFSTLATRLHFSERTLQRKLNQCGTNFKEVEKKLLIRIADKFLLEEDKSIDEISYFLGFSEASAFIRFFKNERKQSPMKYKEWQKSIPKN